MNETTIQEMVDRFLSWKLPEDFAPDGGIWFDKPDNEALWPTGTNLLTATQAMEMVKHILGFRGKASDLVDEYLT